MVKEDACARSLQYINELIVKLTEITVTLKHSAHLLSDGKESLDVYVQ